MVKDPGFERLVYLTSLSDDALLKRSQDLLLSPDSLLERMEVSMVLVSRRLAREKGSTWLPPEHETAQGNPLSDGRVDPDASGP